MRQQTPEEKLIHGAFNALYGLLTSATARAELGDMSDAARAVDAAHHDFAILMEERAE